MALRALVVLLLMNSVLLSRQQTAEDEEIDANSVYVQFDKNEGELLELKEWNEHQATSRFRDITAEEATDWCSNNTAECNLNAGATFNPGDIMLNGDIEFYNGDIRLKVYISLSGKNVIDEDITVIPKEPLIKIILAGQMPYKEGLTDPELEVDYNITLMFVDGERVPPPMDFSVNIIMIVVSLLILLSALLLAMVLKCKESMEEKKQLEQVQEGTSPRDDGENVTLTTMKPAAEEDGKGAEGPVKV